MLFDGILLYWSLVMFRKMSSNSMILFLIRTIAIVCVVLALTRAACWSTEPTLARMSFWAQPGRMAEFETAYKEQILPLLRAHGMKESVEKGRTTPDSVFSRLFEISYPSEVIETQKILQEDMAWRALLKDLGANYGVNLGSLMRNDLLRYSFKLYRVPEAYGRVDTTILGKQARAGPGAGNWRFYGEADGLANGGVGSTVQDQQGNLWFGTTNGGVSRFDGQSWKTFTTEDGLADSRGRVLFVDSKDNLWVGTSNGLCRFDGQSWETFTTKDGMVSNYTWSIMEDHSGQVWFGHPGGVTRYDGTVFHSFEAYDFTGDRVFAIFQDRDGNMWFGTQRSGVVRFNGTTCTVLNTSDGLAHNNVSGAIPQDREGTIWFATAGGGISRYNGQSFTNFTEKDGLVHDTVWAMIKDPNGDLWFATSGGISQYNGQGFRNFTKENGLTRKETSGLLWKTASPSLMETHLPPMPSKIGHRATE